jgi:hypothetical protein
MQVSEILEEIDREIARLQQVRTLLAGEAPKAKVGRPRKSAAAAAPATKKRRKLTPEGRKRIAEAMKKRWAERRKQAAPKPPTPKK